MTRSVISEVESVSSVAVSIEQILSSFLVLFTCFSFLKHPVPTTKFIEEVPFVSAEIIVPKELDGRRLATNMFVAVVFERFCLSSLLLNCP